MYFRRLLLIYFLNIFLTATEVGVNLKNGYNGDISSRDAGRIGGNMVKKLIQRAENEMK
ncbi:MAG: alpha/beta-type small acid-soluble spore protein [Clostridia bacterium]|nr:alpha/beta-type small acid-soluble spore protein [Clostridia bacterium]